MAWELLTGQHRGPLFLCLTHILKDPHNGVNLTVYETTGDVTFLSFPCLIIKGICQEWLFLVSDSLPCNPLCNHGAKTQSVLASPCHKYLWQLMASAKVCAQPSADSGSLWLC